MKKGCKLHSLKWSNDLKCISQNFYVKSLVCWSLLKSFVLNAIKKEKRTDTIRIYLLTFFSTKIWMLLWYSWS